LLPLIDTKDVGLGALAYYHESNESRTKEQFMALMFQNWAYNLLYIDCALQQ